MKCCIKIYLSLKTERYGMSREIYLFIWKKTIKFGIIWYESVLELYETQKLIDNPCLKLLYINILFYIGLIWSFMYNIIWQKSIKFREITSEHDIIHKLTEL